MTDEQNFVRCFSIVAKQFRILLRTVLVPE